MDYYSVISPELETPVADAIAAKLGAAIGRFAVLRTTPESAIGRAFMRHHSGGKYAYWFEASHLGITHCLSPSSGNVRAMTQQMVPNFLKLGAAERRHHLLVTACLLGLEADPHRNASKFLVTYQPNNVDINQHTYLASKLGIMIYNVADRADLARLICDVKTRNSLK